jgi:hypothetical protein
MKVYWEWSYSSTYSLTSALDGGEWSASRTGRSTPRESAPVTHWIRGWVGPRAVLDAVVKRKIHNSCRDSNPWSSSPWPSAIPLSYHGSIWQKFNQIQKNIAFNCPVNSGGQKGVQIPKDAFVKYV